MSNHLIVLVMLVLLAACRTYSGDVPQSPTTVASEFPTITYTYEAENAPTTAIGSPSPIPATPTSPTIPFYTPTPEVQPVGVTSTPGGIIEVTQIGGVPTPRSYYPIDFLEAYYTVDLKWGRMKIRNAASLDGTVVGYLPAGQRTRFYTIIFIPLSNDEWLCLDVLHDLAGNEVGSDCKQAVAYQVSGVKYGLVEIVRP